ncbi:hypothetical protein DNX69_09930 [Rhodopseudomonas palustris]|uniref:Strictosidine synthase conserved region domain-containing protein n=1 Tax=Rhodopseudomonas palustris TaxID=1076 RepID=A0A323UH35_RHOPL|nr:hypothetical protein [Rhodopseudomonas palustris]PZA12302.1 hypothetical protein DNX69_09930 [Rhodopseudomonas palustris]
MIPALREFAHHFLGRGEGAITVPPFDGALKPNQTLEHAEIVATLPGAEDLATDGTSLYVADGNAVLRLDGAAFVPVRQFDQPLTALCVLPDGRLAVALAGREVRVFAPGEAADIAITGAGMTAVNALTPGRNGTLLATDGSTELPYAEWGRDLLSRGRSGRLLAIDPASRKAEVVASGLRYAFGAASAGDTTLVSESWRHRLIAVSGDGKVKPVFDHLPVYPSRLTPAAGGGFWLTAFTARTQLIEFVLREATYRRRMMAEIDPEFWIVPRLRAGQSFREPMQGAHLKTMGIIKPWAPPRAYGLVVRLGADCAPLYSLHSRVDGTNHGVVAAVEVADSLYVLAKGPRRLLRVKRSEVEGETRA